MYVSAVKTIIREALLATFDDQYPNEQFQNTHVELDYPITNQEYPAIFISYEDSDDLRKVGIHHVETVDPDTQADVQAFTRWMFKGNVSLTVVSIATALERDELYDEMIRVVAFGNEDSLVGEFKNYIENNDLIYMVLQTDLMHPRGSSAAPGTPWGTDEIMFERTLDLELVGEFIPDMNGELVYLSAIIITPTEDDGTSQTVQNAIVIPPRMGI